MVYSDLYSLYVLHAWTICASVSWTKNPKINWKLVLGFGNHGEYPLPCNTRNGLHCNGCVKQLHLMRVQTPWKLKNGIMQEDLWISIYKESGWMNLICAESMNNHMLLMFIVKNTKSWVNEFNPKIVSHYFIYTLFYYSFLQNLVLFAIYSDLNS